MWNKGKEKLKTKTANERKRTKEKSLLDLYLEELINKEEFEKRK